MNERETEIEIENELTRNVGTVQATLALVSALVEIGFTPDEAVSVLSGSRLPALLCMGDDSLICCGSSSTRP